MLWGGFEAAVVDLDGDAHLDLASRAIDRVAVFLNNGRGDLIFEVGDLDFAMAFGNNIAQGLAFLLNQGSGTFLNGEDLATEDNPFSTVAGDLDGDGDMDLAVVNYGHWKGLTRTGAGLMVLLNDQGFTPGWDSGASEAYYPVAVQALDLDGDGSLDLATASDLTRDAAAFFNNGEASFEEGYRVSIGGEPGSLFSGDLDGDRSGTWWPRFGTSAAAGASPSSLTRGMGTSSRR